MTVDEVCELMDKQQRWHWRIEAISGDTLAARPDGIDDSQATDSLREHIQYFADMGKVKVIAATEDGKKSNYRWVSKWIVVFGSVPQQVGQVQQAQPQQPAIDINEQIKREVSRVSEIMDLKYKLKEARTGGIPEMWGPVIARLMGIPMDEVKQLAGVKDRGNDLSMEGTKEEVTDAHVKELEDNITALSKSVTIQDMNKMVKDLAEKPEKARMILNMI